MTRALIMVSTTLLLAMQMAWGHDWMQADERWCCSGKDCLPHPRSAIERLPDGWRVKRSGKEFRDGERGVYPNRATDQGEVWLCRPPGAPAEICIFILPEGS